MLLKHLEHSGRILVEETSSFSSDETTLVKFLGPAERDITQISKKEIALFSLQRNTEKIEAKINECMEKAQRENTKIKTLL